MKFGLVVAIFPNLVANDYKSHVVVNGLVIFWLIFTSGNNKVENNYFSYEGDCLVVVWVIIHFRPYFYGTNFTLYIDHQPIKWLMTNDKLTNKLIRRVLILQEYEFKFIHRPSITHQNENTMSQKPLITFEIFSKTKQNFDHIPTVHVSYASNYLALL